MSLDTAEAHVDEPRVDGPRAAIRRGLTAIVCIPIITAVMRALREDWFPIGDNALLFIRTRDVLTDHHPLLGSWTSASLSVGQNMNNPGAMYDWLIAPFAHALPPDAAAAIGVGTVNLALVVGISAVSHRIGGWELQRWVLLVVALLLWSMGSELLIDIWQPNAMVLVIFALLIVAVGLAIGDDALLPWAAILVSLLLQTYLSVAYIFVFLVLGTIGARIWLRPPKIGDRPSLIPISLTAGVLAVLWAPSVYEQLAGSGEGNISRLLANSSGGDVTLGTANAIRIAGSVAALPPWWGRQGYTTTVPVTRLEPDGRTLDIAGLSPLWVALVGFALVISLLVGLTIAMRRRGDVVHVAAGVIAIVVLIGSVLSLGQLTIGAVGLSPHHARWLWPLTAFVHLVIVVSAIDLWRASRDAPSRRQLDRVLGGIVAALIAIVTVLNIPFHAQPSGPTFEYRSMPTMRRIEPSLAELDGFGPVLFDVSNVRIFEPYSSTMMMWMQERGIEFRVDDDIMVRQLGESRRADGTETTTVFQLQGTEALTYAGDACPIGVSSALTPEEEAQVAETVERAATVLAADSAISGAEARDTILRGGWDQLDSDDAADVQRWVESSYALFADGAAC